MPPLLPRLLLTLALAALMAGGAYRARALSRGGAVAAFLAGAAIFGLGGALWGLLLLFFFVSASGLSFWREGEKRAMIRDRGAKGSRRDWRQVAANGGLVGSLLALLQAAGQAGWLPELDLLPAFAGLMAAVTADTWATELGLLSPSPPRLITSGETVPPGMSGGVTVLGLAAAAAGGLAMGGVAALGSLLEQALALRALDLALVDGAALARLALLSPVAGLSAAAVDSYLGATVQAAFRGRGGRETEVGRGSDGEPLPLLRGWAWMDNDRVNLLAGAFGALLALGLDRLLA